MRIETANNYLAASQRPSSADRTSSSSFSAALSTAPASTAQTGPGSAAPPDFTSMTRQELFDWMNGKIKRGEMSLDDSSAFLGMTVKIPVGTGQGAPIALDDWERVNFVQLARDGIAGAQSRNDAMTLAMLQSAMQMMQGDHGANISRHA
ncbi:MULTISPECIES: hypothetical protein [Sphingomonadales]|uniref:Uncharacterized protein n=6 Tax=Alphaproteobacteria TaxID=28211 RepID=A0A8E0WNM5_9SPHN|nr:MULTISPECIES: hypothetical protein [Sphingomonadaceae]AMK21358.1 hypothetical protein K426_01985 [Sphingobium sp. TKS]EQB19400.1 hypothetical protein RLDS_00225 [Sphingobium lactosutens DS20]PJG45443.1 hypothetical protein CAF53_22110 [Sphingobium sp. LB126]AMK20536.1 hypothetical protein K663_20898 [Sphingobium sp. MI1205]KER34572.1 hypothetical protein AL00_20720 [Sphingobium indicum F2]